MEVARACLSREIHGSSKDMSKQRNTWKYQGHTQSWKHMEGQRACLSREVHGSTKGILSRETCGRTKGMSK